MRLHVSWVTSAEILTVTSKVSPVATSQAELIPHPGSRMALEDTVISPYSEILVPAKIVGEPYGEPWGTVGPSPATTLRCYGRKNISGCSA